MKNILLKGTAFALASTVSVMVVKSAKKHCQYQLDKCRLKRFFQKELDSNVALNDVLLDMNHAEIEELLQFVNFYENLNASTDE